MRDVPSPGAAPRRGAPRPRLTSSPRATLEAGRTAWLCRRRSPGSRDTASAPTAGRRSLRQRRAPHVPPWVSYTGRFCALLLEEASGKGDLVLCRCRSSPASNRPPGGDSLNHGERGGLRRLGPYGAWGTCRPRSRLSAWDRAGLLPSPGAHLLQR